MEPQTPTERMIQSMSRANRLLWRISLPIPAKICSKAGSAGRGLRHRHSYHYPSEASIIACDIATKSGAVEIGFLDRFTGAVVLTGDVSAVEYALRQVTRTLGELMRFTACPITRT